MGNKKRTLIVNFYGGQGSGKSTMMANVFAKLKWAGIDCEMCSEFAKELVWENRQGTFKDEMYLFAKQNHRLFRCNGKVDVVLTDRPLLMSIFYNQVYGNPDNKEWNEAYEQMVKETYFNYMNYNILLTRKKSYNPNGRNETEEQALEFDKLVEKAFVHDWNIMDDKFLGDEYNANTITKHIESIVTFNRKSN